MEEWIKFIAPLIGIAGLWWKITASMATKTELTAVKTDLRAEIAEVKADLKADVAEVKSDMAAMRVELKAEIYEVKSDMADMKADLKGEMGELNPQTQFIHVEGGHQGDSATVKQECCRDREAGVIELWSNTMIRFRKSECCEKSVYL